MMRLFARRQENTSKRKEQGQEQEQEQAKRTQQTGDPKIVYSPAATDFSTETSDFYFFLFLFKSLVSVE